MTNKYDWKFIQVVYDRDGLSWNEVSKKFGPAIATIHRAVKNKLFVTRNKSELPLIVCTYIFGIYAIM